MCHTQWYEYKVCIDIYIYIERERERKRDKSRHIRNYQQNEIDRYEQIDMSRLIYIYIYIYREREREREISPTQVILTEHTLVFLFTWISVFESYLMPKPSL